MTSPYRITWWSVTVVVGVVAVAGGCVWLGAPGTVLLAAVTGTLSACAARPRPRTPRLRSPLRPPVLRAVLGGILPLAVIGLVAELGVAGLGLAALVALTGWPAIRGLPRDAARDPGAALARPRAARTGVPALEEVAADPLPTVAALTTLSTPELCRVWRVSYPRVVRSSWPGEREHLAQLRRGCLEQLERRDPAAFRRWFPTARAASDPARFFCPARRPDRRIGPGSATAG